MSKNVKNVTPFGVFVRKLRVEYDETGRDMSRKLGVSPSYLSSIELGDRAIPAYFRTSIGELYKLDKEALKEYDKACQESSGIVILKLKRCTPYARKCALTFFRKLETLSKVQVDEIHKILNCR